MTPIVLDDLNKGDKIRVICKPDDDWIATAIDGEFRGWALSKKVRAIRVRSRCRIPGTAGFVMTFIPTRLIDQILRMGR